MASADMHKSNVGAAFFLSTVSAHRKRAVRFLQFEFEQDICRPDVSVEDLFAKEMQMSVRV